MQPVQRPFMSSTTVRVSRGKSPITTCSTPIVALIFAISILGSGCVYHPLQSPPRATQMLPASLRAEELQTKTHPKIINEKLLKEKSAYTVKEITLSVGNEREVRMNYYMPRHAHPGPTPAIVILPIMGGSSYPVESPFASAFARHGYAAMILHRPDIKKEIKNIEDIDPLLRQSSLDASRVIDWLETQPGIDSKKVGLFGVSLGAIRGTVVMAMDKRIQAGVLGLVGGDLAYILTHCADKRVIKARESILERNHLNLEDAEQRLRDAITYDPMAVAPAVDPSRVMMVIAAFDKVIPPHTGWSLRRKLGNPETIELWSGHYTSVIDLPYLQRATRKFFDKKFAELSSTPKMAAVESK